MASKGKGIADGNDSFGKRKRDDGNGGKSKRNRSILQFFEDTAVEDGGASDSGSDDFFDDDFLADYLEDPKVKSEPGKFVQVPFIPKEEELSGDELEKMITERYRRGYVRYAEDDNESKRSVDNSELMPSGEPTIWKVKCKVGREKNTVFCLIQKYVDLKVLGTKLQIISAFAVEHIKGFVFVEAERQSDVAEACNQLADVYFSLVTPVPPNEVGHLLVVKKRYHEVKEGSWARVKNGIYRGDLAQVVAINNERKRATVKLIPRIDLQALTAKYGGGANSKRTKGTVPAARLISSCDLEEFRPLIQYRRDRDTGKMFEFLDSLMLKDGFLYKKVSIDSLSFWGINPTQDELQKFTISSNDDSGNLEWLSQLYGEPKKKSIVNIDKGGGKGGGKGEGSSGSHEQSSFEVHDLVHFGKRDFGMVVGIEKDESYKILKEGLEGPATLNLGQKDLKYVPLEKKFTALDHRMKTISTNDTVRIVEGPIKGRQGIVKQVYRGIIFLYDEDDLDNAYFCTKSQMTEKVKHSVTACLGKDDGGPSCFEDVPSSPKSPLSPQKPWQRGNNADDQTEKDGIFSVGQSVRIRIGPLKGYLCRVLAVRYSDVTVKLDSKHKVLTVKREHLSEVRGKNSASAIGDHPETSSPFKPFDLLGTEGNTNDWLPQASSSTIGDGWNVGGLSSERSAWPAFPSSGASLQAGTAANDLPSSAEDTAWLSKVAVSDETAVGWGKGKAPVGDHGNSWSVGGCSSSQEKADNETDPWMQGQKNANASGWLSQSAEKGQPDSWDSGKRTDEQGGWNNIGSSGDPGSSGWGKQKTCTKSASWGNGSESGEQSLGKAGGVASAEPKCPSAPAEDSWGKAADGWGTKNTSSKISGWGSTAAVSQSQAVDLAETNTGWGQKDGQNVSVPSEDPWGKVVDKKGDQGNSNRGNGWGSSVNNPFCHNKGWETRSGGFTNSQEQNTDTRGRVSAGWKSGGDGAGGSWSRGFGADNKGGNDSWGQAKNFEDNRGLNRGRGPSGRGRGRDQYGRGRGISFDKDQFSGFGNDNQDNYSSGNKGWKDQPGPSWGNSSVENDGLASSWDKGKSWSDNKGDGCKGWNKSNEPDKNGGGWSSEKSSLQTGWNGTSRNSESDQEPGWGQGSGGRRGGRGFRGGRDQSGRGGGGRSGGRGQFPSWKNEGQGGTSWGGGSDDKTGGDKRGWSRGRGTNGGGEDSGWGKPGVGSSWGTGSGDKTSGDKSSWSKGFNTGREDEGWGKPSEGGSSWGDKSSDKPSAGGSSWGGRSSDEPSAGESSWVVKSNGKPSAGGSSWGGRSSDESSAGGSSWGGKSSGKPSAGGSSWGGKSSDKPSAGGSSWGGKSSDKPSAGGSSWGDKSSDKPSAGGSSWGGRSSNDPSAGGSSGGGRSSDEPNAGRSSWGGRSSDEPSAGGSSWGDKSSDKPSAGGSSWGGRSSDEPGAGGLSWGGKSSDKPSAGGSSWGGRSSDEPSAGGSSWGGGSSDKTIVDNSTGGSSKGWGNGNEAEEEDGNKASGGGSSRGSGGNNKKSGWGNDVSKNAGQGGSWGN
ncbi:protein RNA-directed DNA methylation 3-like isoform X2 [Chenopodium quinoa]|uniref:protein RNA-directed DNA methylation 3-like isoform X2 n=1 Tax=Chenopodium quinoa TaxID=63459 RepID=UPI000B779CA2|nr:protein RNA-directed DNA methylation 3-like isoform X2 [Chenopodium quinoa]